MCSRPLPTLQKKLSKKVQMTDFEGAGRQDGLEIWRIEDFVTVPWEKHGTFHSGDSYVILKTSSSSLIKHHIHFWLGKETSTDEMGTAAIKAVELDEMLDGSPVQHREVQGHESSLFESYFKNGIKYLPGGVSSGFNTVDEEESTKRLYVVKGQRLPKVEEVEIALTSLNKCDSFILDLGKGDDILVFSPQGASSFERYKAIQVASGIRDEDHAGNASVEVIDSDQYERFFTALDIGSTFDDIPDLERNESDEYDRDSSSVGVLYKVIDSSTDHLEEVALSPNIDQEMLDSNDCFILNSNCGNGIFAWIGQKSSKEERVQALKSAESFLRNNDLPRWTKIERIVENAETTMFKQYFKTWSEPEDSPYFGLGRQYPLKAIAEWDVAHLHHENRRRLAKSGGTCLGFMPDDSKGSKDIFRVEEMELVPLETDKYGWFFGGDSYLIKYSYGSDNHIIYFWQGQASSTDEKAAAAIHAVQLDDELGGKAVQVRIVQGQEPRHFLKMFGGQMVVLAGGKASGFKNAGENDTYDVDGTRLFRVRGTTSEDARAVQVKEISSSLNSEDVFILESPSATWIWVGEDVSEDELDMAKNLAPIVTPGRDPVILPEGSEADEFWDALGGKGEGYSKFARKLTSPILEPRLFHCCLSSTGKTRANEIFNFQREDLNSEDVMIMDSGDEIYVWVGSGAQPEEKAQGLAIAKGYLRTDPTQRNEDNTLIFTIKEGNEPGSFTNLFPLSE